MGSRQEREIMHLVRERVPGIGISLIQVEKNNGSIKKGFQINAKGENSGIVVYQENLETACGDSCTAEEAAEHICRTIEKALDVEINLEEIRNWETLKHRVYKKVVNYEKNSGRLSAVLHRRYLDLAEVYYTRIPIQGEELATSEIPVEMPEEWGIPEEEVAAWAERNTEADGYSVQSLSSFMADILFPEEELSPAGLPDMGMYLILNRRKEYGAGILSSRGEMKKFMEQIGENCYILPCSVHELIVVPESQGRDAKILQELVREVNRSEVSAEEFLSDSVYFCHMDSGEVELCSDR